MVSCGIATLVLASVQPNAQLDERRERDATPLEKDQIQGGRARLAVKNSMPASDQGISILSCWRLENPVCCTCISWFTGFHLKA